MAKVIKQGIVQKECYNCKSIIEFAISELKYGNSTDYIGDTSYFRYLMCPACNYKMKYSLHSI